MKFGKKKNKDAKTKSSNKEEKVIDDKDNEEKKDRIIKTDNQIIKEKDRSLKGLVSPKIKDKRIKTPKAKEKDITNDGLKNDKAAKEKKDKKGSKVWTDFFLSFEVNLSRLHDSYVCWPPGPLLVELNPLPLN